MALAPRGSSILQCQIPIVESVSLAPNADLVPYLQLAVIIEILFSGVPTILDPLGARDADAG